MDAQDAAGRVEEEQAMIAGLDERRLAFAGGGVGEFPRQLGGVFLDDAQVGDAVEVLVAIFVHEERRGGLRC